MTHVQYAATIVALAWHAREIPQPDPHSVDGVRLALRLTDLLREAEQSLVDALRDADMPHDPVSFARQVQAREHGAGYGADYAPIVTSDRW